MSVDERTRHELHGKFEELLGSAELAGALMELLPPVGWGEVATKSDLVALETRLKMRVDVTVQREIGALRSDVYREIGSLRTEMGSLRTELHSEVGGLRSEIDARTRQLFFADRGFAVHGGGVGVRGGAARLIVLARRRRVVRVPGTSGRTVAGGGGRGGPGGGLPLFFQRRNPAVCEGMRPQGRRRERSSVVMSAPCFVHVATGDGTMSVDERTRRELHGKFEELLGSDA